MALPSTFPSYHDGDVQVIISGSRKYNLHSGVLRRSSTRFAELLDEERAPDLSHRARKKGKTTRFRIHLHKHSSSSSDSTDGYSLISTPIDSDGRPLRSNTVGLDLENGLSIPQIYRTYDMMLRSYYNERIAFVPNDIVRILQDAVSLVDVAEYLGSVHVIEKQVEVALISEGQLLFRSIAANPQSWIELGYRLRSYAIFKEALIHLAGKFNSEDVQRDLPQTSREVKVVLMRKVEELRELAKLAQKRILSHYPLNLRREVSTGRADRDSIGRASYSNDIMQWMALGLYRHWCAQCLADDNTHHAADGGYGFFTSVGEGGEAYLGKEMVRSFHGFFPMSSKGKHVVENHLSALKEALKLFVQPLLVNNSQLDIRAFPVKHLTCLRVGARDYPWTTEESEEQNDAAETEAEVEAEASENGDFDMNEEEEVVEEAEMDDRASVASADQEAAANLLSLYG